MLRNYLLTAVQYAAFSVTILYLYHGLINFFVLKRSSLNNKTIQQHIGLCLSSAFYSFIVFLQLTRISINFNHHLLHLLWISGSFVTYYYITSIKTYLKDNSQKLNRIKILPIISVAGAMLAYLSWIIFDHSFFVDPLSLLSNPNNLYMDRVGGFKPHTFVKFLSLFVVIPTAYSAIYFLKFIHTHFRWTHKLLAFGIAVDLFAIFNDISIAIIDPELYIPIIFLANLFEIVRITYDNQLEMGRQLNIVTQNYIQSSKLSEAGTYYAYLAHEILNPLSAAIVYFDKLSESYIPHSDTAKKYIASIKRQHEKIERLAKNVKKYTKLSLEGELKEELVTPLIQDALDTISIRAHDKGVQVIYEPTYRDLKIRCLADQITQVITNIVNNSIEAIANLEERWVHIDHQPTSNGTALITIKDSGNGIPKHIQDKMFESRFTTKSETGVGLGLAICFTIIKNHNGKISLNNNGTNTEFLIEIPLV